MKPLNSSLTASLFSLGKGGYSASEALLPADALVIVIQDSPDAMPALPPIWWPNQHCSAWESLPIIRRNAEKAYSDQRNPGISINVSG